MPTVATGQDWRAQWLIAGILAVAAIMRLPALETVPPPLNQDEASRGYDAWAILETGADRHGQHWPLFLESFGPGDYTAALSTYITVPFVAALGPTALAMRLPNAALGVLTVAALYWWLKRQAGPTVGLLAAAALAMDPWHIMLCRTAHESGFAPFFLATAMLALFRSGVLTDGMARGGGPGWTSGAWAFLAGIMFGFHTWDYPATRLFTPLFGVAIALIYRRRVMAMIRDRAARRVFIALGIGLFLGLLPVIITATLHSERLAARAAVTLLIYKGLPAGQMVWAFLRNYASNIDPRYLFLQCDDMSAIVVPGVGQHLPVLVPLFVIGMIRVLAGWRREAWYRLLIAWFLVYPIPAAICADWNPHPMRTVGGMILFPVLTGLGGEWLVSRIAGRQGILRLAVTAAAVALVLNLGHFANSYFREFPQLGRAGYQTAMVEAMRFTAAAGRDADFVLVTNYSNQPYIYALLYQPIDPKTLAGTKMVSAEGRLGFHQILRIGRYYFFPTGFPEAVRRFEEEWSRLPAGSRGLLIDIRRPERPAPGEVLARFPVGDPRADGQILEVCRFQKSQDSSP